MAPPPKVKAIGRESVPGAPGWFDPFLGILNNFTNATSGALDRRLTRKENLLSGEKAGIAFKTPPNDDGTLLADAEWNEVAATDQPAFQNGWVNFNSDFETAGFLAANGRVYLKGLVDTGTVAAGATGTIFTLPAAYWPSYPKAFPTASNSAFGLCWVRSTGEVQAEVGSNVWFGLDGISWSVDCPPHVVPVKWEVVSRPRHVSVTKLERRDGEAISPAWSCTWALNQKGTILLSFQGLTASTEYVASIIYE